NGEKLLEVTVLPRRNSQAICSCCGRGAPLYDRLGVRRFEFIPLWGYRVFLVYLMRRVECAHCGVKVEQVPWARGKRELTDTYQQFLAHWAQKLSWKEVAVSFRTSWEKVFHAVEYIVEWGLQQRDLSGVTAIGVDEIAWRKGHNYLTLVYQIDTENIRLLWVGKARTVKTLLRFFRFFGKERSQLLKYVCSDMWKPYIKVIEKKAGQAVHILDRFHIVAKLNKAIDEVRAGEHRQ
ncbi:MAG: ISL3 family transposase, partial [Gammaproteobacteria bacterium]|nr:ISL3 family transposase [Gammaproteobacteria bacterium]